MAGVITKTKKKAMRRIVRDLRDAKEIENLGIYVTYDSDNVFEARALIIGPDDTPYAKGFFLFYITFPDNYPFSSPTVKFRTSDGMTRFHPNLYISGKVCLSILGTWAGPSWTSSQTLSSVLTTIQSLLDEMPICNEPGYEVIKTPRDKNRAIKYNNMVQHGVYATSVLRQLEKCPPSFKELYPHMKKYFVDNFDWYICKLNTLSDERDGKVDKGSPYSRKIVIEYDYRGILDGMLELHSEFTGDILMSVETLKAVST